MGVERKQTEVQPNFYRTDDSLCSGAGVLSWRKPSVNGYPGLVMGLRLFGRDLCEAPSCQAGDAADGCAALLSVTAGSSLGP